MFITACCHACNPSNHLSRFRSSDEPPEFAPKMLSKLSFIIANAAAIILDLEKGRKKARKTQKTLGKIKNDPESQRCRFAQDYYYLMTSVFGKIW